MRAGKTGASEQEVGFQGRTGELESRQRCLGPGAVFPGHPSVPGHLPEAATLHRYLGRKLFL